MKLKPGDRVIIRSDLKIGQLYDNCLITKSMKKYSGKMAIINKTLQIVNRYTIIVEKRDTGWHWSKEMLIICKKDYNCSHCKHRYECITQ